MLIGGAGFIGDYLADRISRRKKCRIIIPCLEDLFTKRKPANICYIKLDLAEFGEKWTKLVNSAEIIAILTQPDRKIIDNLTSAIKPKGRLKKIVYLSSLLVYGNSPGRQSEKAPLRPVTAYERGKIEEENKLSELAKKNNIKLCVARLANVYGGVKNRYHKSYFPGDTG